jgi:2-polyprenyl-6-methoxyphenol hydroxylase-like FAD-dependent oxidoreductase
VAQVKSAIVIGGGIAGPAAALALRKAGIEAIVYEAYPATAEGMGGMLMVAPNGLNALAVIGLDDAVAAVGQPIGRMVMADARGKQLMEIPCMAARSRLMAIDLYRVVRNAAIAQVFGSSTASAWLAAREMADSITATFEDGASATADILIGATESSPFGN